MVVADQACEAAALTAPPARLSLVIASGFVTPQESALKFHFYSSFSYQLTHLTNFEYMPSSHITTHSED